MADTATSAPPADDKATQDAPKPTPPPARETDKADDTDWKAQARKWETRARENKDAADELARIRESQKSEAEKVADRLRQAQEEAQQARADAARFRIAAEHRLSPEDAELLTGDEDAMKRLAARLAAAAEASASPRTPRPNPAQRVGDTPAEDKDAVAKAFFGIT